MELRGTRREEKENAVAGKVRMLNSKGRSSLEK